jgi:hypothetical protein
MTETKSMNDVAPDKPAVSGADRRQPPAKQAGARGGPSEPRPQEHGGSGVRDAAGRFVPGVSGNPGGRPKNSLDLRRIVVERSEQAGYDLEGKLFGGLRRVIELMGDRSVPPAVAIQAARAIASALGTAEIAVESRGPSLEELVTQSTAAYRASKQAAAVGTATPEGNA